MNDNEKPGESKSTPPEQHSKMAVPKDSEPGGEFDSHGNLIPLEKRTSTDKERARTGHTK